MDDRRKSFRRFSNKLLSNLKAAKFGVAGAVAVGVIIYKWQGHKKVYASWTTNYEPSCKWDTNWDRRDPQSLVRPPNPNKNGEADLVEYDNMLKKQTPTASRHILLIRHGQYFDNAMTDKERFLTSLGRAQADLTGQRLKQLDLPYTALISSTMTRALETAKLVNKHMPDLVLQTDDSLREGAPIPPEPPIGGWRPEPKQFFMDGARIESAFRKYFYRADASQKEDSYEIIVCHANVIRYFICRALQVPPEAWLRFSLAHASVSYIVIRPSGRVAIQGVGDHGHMPREEISFS